MLSFGCGCCEGVWFVWLFVWLECKLLHLMLWCDGIWSMTLRDGRERQRPIIYMFLTCFWSSNRR